MENRTYKQGGTHAERDVIMIVQKMGETFHEIKNYTYEYLCLFILAFVNEIKSYRDKAKQA